MIWRTISYDINYLNEKKDEFKRDDIMTTLLLNKNITTKEEVYNYLNLSYKHLNDPFLLENMREIVNLILKFIRYFFKYLIFIFFSFFIILIHFTNCFYYINF